MRILNRTLTKRLVSDNIIGNTTGKSALRSRIKNQSFEITPGLIKSIENYSTSNKIKRGDDLPKIGRVNK